jgi:hypothetical protein
MRNLIFIGAIGLAIAGMFVIAMANPVVGFLCLLPIFVATQK